MMDDYIEYGPDPSFVREIDGTTTTIVIQRVGPSWGYTIWMLGKCVQGGYALDWQRDEAVAEAERKYKELTR